MSTQNLVVVNIKKERGDIYKETQIIYFLPEEKAAYEKAARLYFDLRRKGITPRSTIDILIALTAIENKLMLLHNDRDFDLMAEQVDALKILLYVIAVLRNCPFPLSN